MQVVEPLSQGAPGPPECCSTQPAVRLPCSPGMGWRALCLSHQGPVARDCVQRDKVCIFADAVIDQDTALLPFFCVQLCSSSVMSGQRKTKQRTKSPTFEKY